MKCDLMLDGIWNVTRDSTSCLAQRLKGAITTAAKSLFYALKFFFLEKPRRFSDGKSYERAGAWQKEMTPLFQREMGCGVLRDV